MFPRKSFSINKIDTAAIIPEALAPTFSVTIDHATVGIAEVDALTRKSNDWFQFNVIANDKLNIAVTPHKPFSETDIQFRNACAMLTRFKLTTKDCVAIIQAYEAHLSRHKVASEFTAKKSAVFSNGMNPNGVC